MEGHETVNEQGNFTSVCWVKAAATGPGLAGGHSHLEDLINRGLMGRGEQQTFQANSTKKKKKKKLLSKVDIKRKTPLNVFKSYLFIFSSWRGLPWWLSFKESACNVGDPGLILGSGRSPGEGSGNPL